MALDKAKHFVATKFEILLVLIIFAGLSTILIFVPEKLGFLNFFYLPTLAAGYAIGRKEGVLVALASILFVILTVILFP
ncbi:MAG: hypothetical protein DRI92_04575, partial [Aquificota bacterium]